jgi:hypothetical protein
LIDGIASLSVINRAGIEEGTSGKGSDEIVADAFLAMAFNER